MPMFETSDRTGINYEDRGTAWPLSHASGTSVRHCLAEQCQTAQDSLIFRTA